MPLGRRRRPLVRAAMVGGAAYATGKHVQRGQQHEAEQDQALDDAQAEQEAYDAPAGDPPAASESPTDRYAALTQLKELLDGGVLTQDEFDSEKQKILQAS
jgi:hypothetical protein